METGGSKKRVGTRRPVATVSCGVLGKCADRVLSENIDLNVFLQVVRLRLFARLLSIAMPLLLQLLTVSLLF